MIIALHQRHNDFTQYLVCTYAVETSLLCVGIHTQTEYCADKHKTHTFLARANTFSARAPKIFRRAVRAENFRRAARAENV